MLRTICKFFCLALLMAAQVSHAAAVADNAPVKQADLAKKLVDIFGWSEGLPEKPADADYLAILGGNRNYKFEAEDVYDSYYDTVTVRNYNLFGPFTGKGWVHGITTPTAVHFKVLIPISGKYTVKASTKGDDQLWSVAGMAFKLNAGAELNEKTVGQVFIPAGILEFNAVIPANGAIDYIRFTAPSLAPIEPLSGWNLAAGLQEGQLAEVAAALLGSDPLLEDDPSAKPIIIHALTDPLPDGLLATESQIFGKTIAQKWVRASQAQVTLPLKLDIDTTAVYRVRVRFLGQTLTAGIGARSVTVPGKGYLDWVDLGVFRLSKGNNLLELTIPPAGGVDSVEIVRKRSSPSDYVSIMKLGKGAGESVTADELDRVLKGLQDKFKERR